MDWHLSRFRRSGQSEFSSAGGKVKRGGECLAAPEASMKRWTSHSVSADADHCRLVADRDIDYFEIAAPALPAGGARPPSAPSEEPGGRET
jgi:hypothetical protein